MAKKRSVELLLAALILLAGMWGKSIAAQPPIRVLFVGGDWKSQLQNYRQEKPLRGYFIRQEVQKAVTGRFEFTLQTSYEFLQYADTQSLRQYDVVVVGDTMGQSVTGRVARGVTAFVEGGGGFLYCDNHKAFSFNTKPFSFDEVLPIEMTPFRPYDENGRQPLCEDKPLKVNIRNQGHPIVRGLDWASAPPLRAARYGPVKPGATVLAASPSGKPIWVAWEKGGGRALWLGGVFANDELSEDFSAWPQFGKFYAQTLAWLAEKSSAPKTKLRSAGAQGELTVDVSRPGAAVTAAHFGIHGQEDAPGGSRPMEGADLALYRELKLDGTFARTGIASPGDFVQHGPQGRFDFVDDGADLTRFDWSKYDFQKADVVLRDIDRIHARPITLAWCPWWGPDWPQPRRYTKYFAAFLQHCNGEPGKAEYRPRVEFFEVMNEPNLHPAAEVLPRYADFFNYAAGSLGQRYAGVKFGCGGFYEWSYIQRIIDRCGKNLGWISRHPYGHTGEAVFYLQDQYAEYARSQGIDDLKFIITEWDFWIYGRPAFDYIMMRWKPLIDHADSCLGTLHYRWREYQEGGYVFGLHGEFDKRYGELPAEWPNPGRDKPITYRYNAFWIMRDCRGPQFPVQLDIPAAAEAEGTHAYAAATSNGRQYNIVVYYGYPIASVEKGVSYDKLKLRVRTPIPANVRGRTLVVARADEKTTRAEPARRISGEVLDMEVEIPSGTAVSLTIQ